MHCTLHQDYLDVATETEFCGRHSLTVHMEFIIYSNSQMNHHCVWFEATHAVIALSSLPMGTSLSNKITTVR